MAFSSLRAFMRLSPQGSRVISTSRIDHVCLVVRDVKASVQWYQNVLQMKHEYQDHPSFGLDPAIMRSGTACIALLPLSKRNRQIDYHNGAHTAFTVSKSEFLSARKSLPALLAANRVSESQDVDVLEEDYGIQKSIFFKDPDGNILEITYWDTPDKPASP